MLPIKQINWLLNFHCGLPVCDVLKVRAWQNGQSEGAYNAGEEIWDMFIDGNRVITVRDRDVVISEFGSKVGIGPFLCRSSV